MGDRWVILYDRDCGFCRWSLAKVLALDTERRLEPLPLGDRRGIELLRPMAYEQRMASWHLVAPYGRRWSAGDAFEPLVAVLGHPRAARALRPARPLLRLGYRFVAANRSIWGRLVSDDAKRRADALIEERRR